MDVQAANMKLRCMHSSIKCTTITLYLTKSHTLMLPSKHRTKLCLWLIQSKESLLSWNSQVPWLRPPVYRQKTLDTKRPTALAKTTTKTTSEFHSTSVRPTPATNSGRRYCPLRSQQPTSRTTKLRTSPRPTPKLNSSRLCVGKQAMRLDNQVTATIKWASKLAHRADSPFTATKRTLYKAIIFRPLTKFSSPKFASQRTSPFRMG